MSVAFTDEAVATPFAGSAVPAQLSHSSFLRARVAAGSRLGCGVSIRISAIIGVGRRPMIKTRSERNAASRILWVTTTLISRVACQMRNNSSLISSRVIAWSTLNGSS